MSKVMIVLFVLGFVFCGCAKEEAGTKEAPPAAAKGGEAKGEVKAAPGAAPAEAGSEIGVPECDEYLKKMEECLAKMPGEAKTASEAGLKQSREAWKSAAGTEAGKAAIKTACKASLDALANNPMCK